MQLVIDELTQSDLEDPIVLVKDFRERTGEDSIEIFFVPKISEKDDSKNTRWHVYTFTALVTSNDNIAGNGRA